mgnify:CR=1 FL=1
MCYSARCVHILKMYKPVFTIFCMYPSTLMRSIHRGFSAFQYTFPFIWTIRRFTAHSQLPASSYTTGRTKNPIPAVTLIKLRPFGSNIACSITIEYNTWLTYGACAISRQFTYSKHTIKTYTTVSPSIDKITTTILIPQRSRIDIPETFNHHHRFFPFTCRIFGFHHKNTPIGISPIDIEFA